MKALLKLLLGAVGVGLFGILALAALAFFKGAPVTLEEQIQTLPPAEKEAWRAVLAEAGISGTEVRLVGLTALQHNPRAISIDNGQVSGIRLEKTRLRHLKPFSGFPALETLWLADNEIETLSGFAGGKKLQTLLLGKNRLASLEGALPCESLKTLSLTGNPLKSLQGIEGLATVVDLDLSHGELAGCGNLRALTRLEKLNVSHNQLTSAADLHQMRTLKELILDHNRLTSLEGIEWPALEKLSVSHNLLQRFQAKMIQSPGLSQVDVSWNQLVDLPRRPSLTPGFTMITDGNPPPPKPVHWLQELPWSGVDQGKTPGMRLERSGDSSSLMPAGAFHEQVFGKLSGAGPVAVIDESRNQSRYLGTLFDVEATVKKGKIRVYLEWRGKGSGYEFAEAGPGTPGKARGYLWDFVEGKTISGYAIEVIESPAEDVRIQLKLAQE